MRTQAGVYWVRDRTRTVAERYGTVRSKRLRSFCKWHAFSASALSNATWLSGCWTLSKQQEQASESYLRAKHRLAGLFARFEYDNPKFGGDHPQRFNAWRWETFLEHAYGCARLARGEDPHAVGWIGVALNRCQWKAGEGAFFASCR